MKPVLCMLLALALSFSDTLSAQRDLFQSELYIGAGGGATAYRMDFLPSVPQTLRLGYMGGIAAKYISENHLGVVVELNYTQRGWEEEFAEDSEFTYHRTLNYLELPFMTHIYVGNKTRFIINIGPQVSFLLNDSEDMNQALAENIKSRREANPGIPIGYQYNPIGEMRKVDYGLVGGLGMELRTGIGVFDLEGRYYFGLGDLFTNRRSKNAYFQRSAHRIIEAKLTYYIQVR